MYTFYCATIAYHVELNANSGGHRHPANVQEKWTFSVGRSLGLYSRGTLLNSSSFSHCNFEPYPSAVI